MKLWDILKQKWLRQTRLSQFLRRIESTLLLRIENRRLETERKKYFCCAGNNIFYSSLLPSFLKVNDRYLELQPWQQQQQQQRKIFFSVAWGWGWVKLSLIQWSFLFVAKQILYIIQNWAASCVNARNLKWCK